MALQCTVGVFCDFSGTVYGGSPTWTDVSSYVWSENSPVTVTWGRQDQFSQVTPSQSSVTYNNADGRFTPGRTTLVTGGANPYSPNVKRRIRQQIRATVSGTTVNVFDGFTDSWDVTPSTSQPWSATQACTDILGRMGSDTPLRNMATEEQLVDSPAALYPLDDPAGSTSAGAVVGSTAPVVHSKYGGGAYAFGQAPILPTGWGSALTTTIGTNTFNGYALIPPISTITPSATNPVAAEGWFATTATTGGVLVEFCNTATALLSVSLTATGGINFLSPPGASNTVGSGYNDGHPHHLFAQFYNLGTGAALQAEIYVDGVALFSGSVFASTWASDKLDRVFLFGRSDEYGSLSFLPGTYQQWAIYTPTVASGARALTSTRILAHYNAGANGLAGESTNARITRLLSYRANLGSSLAAGNSAVGLQDTEGSSLEQALLDVNTVEGGVLYVNGSGQIQTRNRSTVYNPTPVLTLDAHSGAVDIGTDFRVDTQGVVNDVTVSRPAGSDQRVQDSASQAAEGISAASFSGPFNSDRDAADAAGWTVAEGVQEQLTIPTLTVDLLTCPAATALAVLQLDPLDAIQVTNLPSASPAASMTLIVEGGSLTFSPTEMKATLHTTPVPPVTLRADATADTFTKLDNGLVFAW